MFYDPWVKPEQAMHEYGIGLVATPEAGAYGGVVLAVAHQQFTAMTTADLRSLCQPTAVIYDVKGLFPADQVDGSL